jgi:hypothetical protein
VERKSEPAVTAAPAEAPPEAAPLTRTAPRAAPPRRRGALVLALVAIAAIVTVAIAMRGPTAEERQQEQLARAERALEKGRYDGPRGAIALAQKVLDEHPGQERALDLQKKIAKALQREARTAEQEERMQDAIASLRLLESLEPTRNVRARLKRLEKRLAAAAAPREEPDETVPGARVVALYLQPSQVVAGQRVAIVARTTGPRDALDASSFHVRTASGGAAVLAASRSGDGGTYTASHTFAEAGRYQVGFAGYWAQVMVAEAAAAPAEEAAPQEPGPEATPVEPEPHPAEVAPAPAAAPTEEPEPAEPEPAPTPDPPPEPSPS